MARKSSCLSGCFYYLGILTLLGVVAAYFAARHYMLHPPSEWGRSPEYLAEKEAFFNDPITLPKEWQEVKPFPADLLELRKKLEEAAAPWTVADPTFFGMPQRILPPIPSDDAKGDEGAWAWDQTVNYGDVLSATEIEETQSALSVISPLLAALSDLVNHASFELDAFPLEPPFRTGSYTSEPAMDGRLLVGLAGHLGMRSVYETEVNRNLDAAWRDGRLLLRMARGHPLQSTSTKMDARWPINHGVSVLHYLIGDIQDPSFLQSELGELKKLLPEILPQHESEQLVGAIAQLRWKIRHGEQFDLSRKMTGAEYFQESFFGKDPPKPQSLEEIAYYFLSFVLPVDRLGLRGFYDMDADVRNDDIYLVILAKYDLLLLAIANRILELEGLPKATATAQFVPRFFESDPTDRFAEQPYLWDATHEVFYSIGPDQIDQGNRPFSRRLKDGDISLLHRENTEEQKTKEEKLQSEDWKFGRMALLHERDDLTDEESFAVFRYISAATQPLTDAEVLQAIDRVKGATE